MPLSSTQHGPISRIVDTYTRQVRRLALARSTTEPSYYPAIKSLLECTLTELNLPFEVRINTTEERRGGGRDLPDIAIYDGPGGFLVASGEVKLPDVTLEDTVLGRDRNDQGGRYLAQTGVLVLSNVRHFRSIPELVRALQDFRALYNQHWLIERLGFQSPAQARQRLAIESAA